VMILMFNGAGRARLICNPGPSIKCLNATTQVAWRREWTLPIPGGPSITPVAPMNFAFFTAQSTMKPGIGAPCDEQYIDQNRSPFYSIKDPREAGGQLEITASVPLTEEEGQQPPTASNPSCLGVGVTAGPGQTFPYLLYATTSFGSYADWVRAKMGAVTHLVSGSHQGLSNSLAVGGTGNWDWIGALTVCEGGCLRDPVIPELNGWVNVVAAILANYGNLHAIPPTVPPATGGLDGEVSIDSGTRSTSSARGRAPILLATLHQQVTKDRPVALRPAFTTQGRKALALLKGKARFEARMTFTPRGGAPLTSTFHFSLAPVAPEVSGTAAGSPTAASITSVRFSGGPANPTVVVSGRNLGSRPSPDPGGHPSGLNGCPTVAGDTGYDYGTSLYLAPTSGEWAVGRYRPELNETDCLDLVVTKFTPTEVDFHFGPSYKNTYPKFALAPGSQVQIVVNGATYDTTVKYG